MADLKGYKLRKNSQFDLMNVKIVNAAGQEATPRGTAIFPKLNEPDTKFKAEGQYTCRLRLAAADAAPLVAKIDELAEVQLELERERITALAEEKENGKPTEKAKKAKAILAGKVDPANNPLRLASKPYKAVLDDEGEETGDYDFNFKMAAQYTERATKKVVKQAPALIDSKGKALKRDEVKVWGGSVVKIGGHLKPFAKPIGCGVALGMGVVQVIKLVSGGASSFNMGEEEDGFEADSSSDTPSDTSSDTPKTDAPSGDDDF